MQPTIGSIVHYYTAGSAPENCSRCGGSGQVGLPAIAIASGDQVEKPIACGECQGSGRFQRYPPMPCAAIVTAVLAGDAGAAHLTIFNPDGFFLRKDVPFAQDPKPLHWSWPPRG